MSISEAVFSGASLVGSTFRHALQQLAMPLHSVLYHPFSNFLVIFETTPLTAHAQSLFCLFLLIIFLNFTPNISTPAKKKYKLLRKLQSVTGPLFFHQLASQWRYKTNCKENCIVYQCLDKQDYNLYNITSLSNLITSILSSFMHAHAQAMNEYRGSEMSTEVVVQGGKGGSWHDS